ncbi:hypothetical protein FBF72_43675, partial [Bradyrhizobium elkanii]|nr:hypothetical protein [Bradyrhizobium elkanii]
VFVSTRRKDVDGRDKPGHDGAEESVHSYAIALPPAGRGRIASVMQSGRGGTGLNAWRARRTEALHPNAHTISEY